MAYLFETEDHAAIRASTRRFAEAHVAPFGAAWEEDEEFPAELYRTAASAGLTGIGYPEAMGGQGGDLSHVLVASDELIHAGRSVGTAVGLGSHGIALPPIVRFGTPEQQRRFVTPCLTEGKIAALAVTEPGGGSDVAALATRAERDGDHYVVTGTKTFITSGARADLVTCAVRTGGPGHGGIRCSDRCSARRTNSATAPAARTASSSVTQSTSRPGMRSPNEPGRCPNSGR